MFYLGEHFIEVKTQHACIINVINFKTSLAAPGLPSGMQDHLVTARGILSQPPRIGSVESWPLDHQGSPQPGKILQQKHT